jgi:catechol 2,3-dioxygenase-like lactoylglutathione lyase family enzyme
MSAQPAVAVRRRPGLAAAIAAAVLAAALAVAAAEPPAAPITVSAVDSIGVTVSNLQRSIAFFRDVLSFEVEAEVEASGRAHELLTGVFGARARTARMRLGEEHLELTEFLAPRGRDFPADTRSNDAWFQHVAIITSDMAAAYARLRSMGVAHASTAPQRLPEWNRNAAGIEAFYFRDPDGHFLEVLQFPADKGAPRWQQQGRLFLGIDHTAIVSSDTERSLHFYRDGLGMRVAGGSENHGEEQEHLNNVFGARLRITTLQAAEGPGVELLEYLTPRDGRPAPRDLRANDLAHWQTTLVAGSVGTLLRTRFGGWLVSPDVVTPAGGFARGLLVRDPDGHAIRVVER